MQSGDEVQSDKDVPNDCVAHCGDTECGDNGCGGQCGTCPAGDACTQEGQCCTPDCAGKTCGDNGCGGFCGTCTGQATCSLETGTCGEPQYGCDETATPGCVGCACHDCVCDKDDFCCTSGWDWMCVIYCQTDCGGCLPCNGDCNGKECGDDGCGGTCGTCDAQSTCNWDTGTCEPHNGCIETQTPGCVGCACHDCVCNKDDYCCVAAWDWLCVNYCKTDCGGCLPCDGDCVGKTCGSDGCGGSCGSCQAGQACGNGTCSIDTDGDGDPDVTDCKPTDPAIHHGINDVCNGVDDDCNEVTDDGVSTCEFGQACSGGACADVCEGQPDFTPCVVITSVDYSFDICSGGDCVSPGTCALVCNAPGPNWPLADTRESKCYDNNGEIPCPSTPGTPDCETTAFCGQDAQYGWDTDHDLSQQYDRNEGNEPVVQDSVTGLIWQGCRAGLAGPSCTMITDSAECDGPIGKCYQKTALAYCDSLAWGGFYDWRLPNLFELQSIVDYGEKEPSIDQHAFPATPSGIFMTSATVAPGLWWAVAFDTGAIVMDDSPQYVRCVRHAPSN